MPQKKKEQKPTEDKALAALQVQIEQLEKQLTEQEEITKRAQSDYFRLKMDMDAYISRADAAKKTERVDALVNMGGKLLPFLTQLEQSIAHTPEELKDNPWANGVALIQQKALGEMSSLGIMPIAAEEGSDPDLTFHMPINMQDVEDKKLKGKIVQVVEAGWKYDKDGVVQVISPAKVVVGT
jgi:molecular chaperone GrpE